MNEYDQGSLVHLSATFTDPITGAIRNPSQVVLKIAGPAPSSEKVTPTLGTDGEYTYDRSADTPGVWTYRFEATGTYQAAAQDSYRVLPSAFPN